MAWRRTICFGLRSVTWHAAIDPAGRAGAAVGGCGAGPGGRERSDAAVLYGLTGGNAFYVTEVVQAGLGVVPPSARDAVLARAVRLGGGPVRCWRLRR